MNDESEKLSASAVDAAITTSMLPPNALAIMQYGLNNEFQFRCLDLSMMGIDDNMIPELCDWLAKLDEKVDILLLDSKLTSAGAGVLFDKLRLSHSKIKRIDFNYCYFIDDSCINSFGEFIKSNKNIEIVQLNGASITEVGIENLASYLDGNKTLLSLSLSGDVRINDNSIPIFIKMIESSKIKQLDITRTGITQSNALAVPLTINAIKYESSEIYHFYKHINDGDMAKICESIKKYRVDKLKNIYFDGNDITSKGASLLFDALRQCNSVISNLSLSENHLDDECITSLCEFIQSNPYLESVRLGHNNITDKGVEILAEFLIGNVKLRELYLQQNTKISDASLPFLTEIANKSHLNILDVYNSAVSENKRKELQELLNIPFNHREVPISSNSKSAAKILL